MAEICGAKKKSGEACGALPIKGGTRCWRHGGKAPQVRKAAERQVVEAELENNIRALGIREKYPDVDPGQALLREIQITQAHVEWLREKVAALDEDELTWGRTQHEFGAGPEGPIDKETFKATPSIWFDLYERERERLVKFCPVALKAGIEERRVRLAEQEGLLVAGVLRRILNALDLTPAQWELTQTVVPPRTPRTRRTPHMIQPGPYRCRARAPARWRRIA